MRESWERIPSGFIEYSAPRPSVYTGPLWIQTPKAKWLPPNGFTGKVHHADVRVGGTYKMTFTNFTTGKSHSFGGEYPELLPYERIRFTDKSDDPNLPGDMQVTISLKKVPVGTELHIEQAGLPDVIPPDACYLGWQELNFE